MEKNFGKLMGESLLQQISNISKASAYDIVSKQVGELQEENKQLKEDKKALFDMVVELKWCINRLCKDNVSQFERDGEAQWEGEAHELLLKINPNYYKNANI